MNNGDRYLEIIHVRLASRWSDTLMAELHRSIAEQSSGCNLRIFSRVGLEGDIGIHIVRYESVKSSGMSSEMSSRGLGLASELRDLGMVEHSLWVEREMGET